MSEFESVRMKARKLAALAARGVGGEASNARRLLHELLSKHGLSMAEIEDAEKRERRLLLAFNPSRPGLDKDLLLLGIQCLGFVIQESVKNREAKQWQFKYELDRKGRKAAKAKMLWVIEADVTEAEFEDWNACFHHYLPSFLKSRDQLRKAAKAAFSGFIHQHDLFPPTQQNAKSKPLSREELEALIAAMKSSHGDTWERPKGRLEQPSFMLT